MSTTFRLDIELNQDQLRNAVEILRKRVSTTTKKQPNHFQSNEVRIRNGFNDSLENEMSQNRMPHSFQQSTNQKTQQQQQMNKHIQNNVNFQQQFPIKKEQNTSYSFENNNQDYKFFLDNQSESSTNIYFSNNKNKNMNDQIQNENAHHSIDFNAGAAFFDFPVSSSSQSNSNSLQENNNHSKTTTPIKINTVGEATLDGNPIPIPKQKYDVFPDWETDSENQPITKILASTEFIISFSKNQITCWECDFTCNLTKRKTIDIRDFKILSGCLNGNNNSLIIARENTQQKSNSSTLAFYSIENSSFSANTKPTLTIESDKIFNTTQNNTFTQIIACNSWSSSVIGCSNGSGEISIVDINSNNSNATAIWKGKQNDSVSVLEDLGSKQIAAGSASTSGVISIWDCRNSSNSKATTTTNSNPSQSFSFHQNGVSGISSISNEEFLSSSFDGSVCYWDRRNSQAPIHVFIPQRNISIQSMHLNGAKRTLNASLNTNGALHLNSMPDFNMFTLIIGNSNSNAINTTPTSGGKKKKNQNNNQNNQNQDVNRALDFAWNSKGDGLFVGTNSGKILTFKGVNEHFVSQKLDDDDDENNLENEYDDSETFG